MITTDPIADMLTRIRNAQMSRRDVVRLPHSKLKQAIAEILKTQGYIDSYSVDNSTAVAQLELQLTGPAQSKSITKLIRVSKPGRRMYAKVDEIPKVLNGRGTMIVSTSAGLMTGSEARSKRLGGELICKVW
jgi:small subunit ribosomal protein S8